MQNQKLQGHVKDRLIMAHTKRSLTPKQAWRLFEEYVRNVYTIEEAAEWLRKHPEVAKKMTGAGLLACFDEDVKNKY
jgi:hypothetical protein